jgi:hypothetical protein
MATKSYSNLHKSSSTWNSAIRNFGIVTVMNAKVYNVLDGMSKADYTALTPSSMVKSGRTLTNVFEDVCGSEASVTAIDFSTLKADGILTLYLAIEPIATLKYLKTANSTQEGPTKTITGGQNASTILKYGKKARLEMTDALGNAEALEALTGLTVEYFRDNKATSSDLKTGASDIIHATTTFASPKTIIGDTFIVDTENGTQSLAYITFYDFLSDSLFNLTQDSEGDATVFDMNGDLNEVKIIIGDADKEAEDQSTYGDEGGVLTGVFYTILPQLDYVKDPDALNPA